MAKTEARPRHLDLGLSDDEVMGMYRQMLLARAVDERMWLMQRAGKIAFIISGQGHEGAQVATTWPLRRNQDWLAPYYRSIASVITFGMSAEDIITAHLAKGNDVSSGGRQMPGHYGGAPYNIVSLSSPVGTQVLHAVGIAMAAWVRGEDVVALTSFGEGTSNQGEIHEAMNFAGVHRLPVIFVCENNGYAISVPLDKQVGGGNVAVRAEGYGFPGVVVDGTDPLACYAAAKAAHDRARRGEGPTLIEARVVRMTSHSSDDDQRRYRDPAEVEALKGQDPMSSFGSQLREWGLLSDERDAELRAEAKAEVNEASRRAEARPEPDVATAERHVYADAEGQLTMAELNILEAIRTAMDEELERDERVMVLGEDVGKKGGVFGATEGLFAKYGEKRVLDTPLTEGMIAGAAAGAAIYGLRPIAEMQFADFVYPAFNQIVSEISRMRYRSNNAFGLPMVIRMPYGGGVHGALYHSQSNETYFTATVGLKVVAPGTPADAKGLLKAAVRDPDPVMFFEHKKTYRLFKAEVPDGDHLVPIGKAEVARPGKHLSIFCYGYMRTCALEAAETLAREDGVEAEVVDLRTLRPLDTQAIAASVAKTGKALVVHEANKFGGFGAEVAATIAQDSFEDLDGPVMRLAGPEVPGVPFHHDLEEWFMLGPQKIVDAARELAAY